eukprot:TRINITY_DN4496_c0_g4_i1.p1 TRINITY_DN4496_c0_g4~~TRINITY_DN4496_c0_g4_i1.p1  ORF type:complete len:147 (-),score=53.30 TRINITY_DN4496_c0_g4_i1:111-551(-)
MAAKALKEAGTALKDAAIKRKNNLLEIAFGYKDWGLGLKVTRSVWGPDQHSFWTITRVIPTLNSETRKRGRVYGVLTWRGVTYPKEVKIRSILKRQWEVVNNQNQSSSSFFAPLSSTTATNNSDPSTTTISNNNNNNNNNNNATSS